MNPDAELMVPEQASAMLAFYYKEPVLFKSADGREILNPRVRAVTEWFAKNYVTAKGMLQMVEKIKANFQVTADHPFPTIQHLNEIYWMIDSSPHQTSYGDTRGATMTGALIEFSRTNNVTFEPPEAAKDTPLEVLCRYEKRISFDAMLRKYGVRRTYEAVKFNFQQDESA